MKSLTPEELAEEQLKLGMTPVCQGPQSLADPPPSVMAMTPEFLERLFQAYEEIKARMLISGDKSRVGRWPDGRKRRKK